MYQLEKVNHLHCLLLTWKKFYPFSSCRTFSGPGSGWSRTGSISGYSASGRGSAGPGYWGGASDFWPGDEDAISDLMVIKRVDSNEVEYETKRKPTKVLKQNITNIRNVC